MKKKKIAIIPSFSLKNDKNLIREETKVIKEAVSQNNIKEEEEEEEEEEKLKEKEYHTTEINKDKVISGLSISSLRIKKSIKKFKEKGEELINSKYQDNEFSNEELKKMWVKYYSMLIEKGEKNLASILQIDEPILKNKQEIHFTLSNNINKIELEKNKVNLLNFLKEKLNNNLIEIILHVNKQKEKEFIYSPTEKFEKLKEINPTIEKMRKEFKLGL